MRAIGLTLRSFTLGCSLVCAGCGGSSVAIPCGDLPGKGVRVLPSKNVPAVGAAHDPYNSIPPTSGAHVPFTAAPGPYDEQIPDEVQVRVLEYGHVLIQYGESVPSSDVTTLNEVARRHPRDVLVAPYKSLGSEISLTAWGRIERLHRAEQRRIEIFVRALAGRYSKGWKNGAHPCPENA